jgi:chorismate dehydratase
MLHGDQRDLVELSFSLPSECARQIEERRIDIGLLPSAEIARQDLEIISRVGIACRGPVRSILLFARVPFPQVRTLAVDSGSRTSVELARIILAERYGAAPQLYPAVPDLNLMLTNADAALIIGDPALRIDPDTTGYDWLDLGYEWFQLTRLPMVFAAWARRQAQLQGDRLEQITSASYASGRHAISQIAEREHSSRGISRELAERYLREHIHYELGENEHQGLAAFLEFARLDRGAVARRQ